MTSAIELAKRTITVYTPHEPGHDVVAPVGRPCVLPGKKNCDARMTLKSMTPDCRSKNTVESLEKIRAFDPVATIHYIAPLALLLIAEKDDNLIPLETLRESFDPAGEFVEHPIRHFDIYAEPWRSMAASAVIDRFSRHFIDRRQIPRWRKTHAARFRNQQAKCHRVLPHRLPR